MLRQAVDEMKNLHHLQDENQTKNAKCFSWGSTEFGRIQDGSKNVAIWNRFIFAHNR
jgi:hypothetical protein